MIIIALFCTFMGIFFQQELAKNYNPKDAFANAIPRLLSIFLLLVAGSVWTLYFIQLGRYG